MIRIPLSETREKIKAKTGISDAELDQKIEAKLKQLSGLISKEGAAHIIANELGVKLFENSGKIKDIYPGMRNINMNAQVIQVYEAREFSRSDGSQGKVCSCLVGDETGTIRVVGWGAQADRVKQIQEGDIIGVQSGYARENNRGYREIHLNDNAKVEINPQGVTVQAVRRTGSAAASYTRKAIVELSENDNAVEISGYITQVFDIRFFEVCPECGKRIKQQDEGFMCPSHQAVVPDYSYVLNIFMEDGSERIRIVLFRDLIEKLTKKNKEQILLFREQPEQFEAVKTELLGEQFVMQGRIKKNTFFDRIEFVPNTLKAADPEEELAKLN